MLHRAGQLIPLRPKAFQVLTYLLMHHDRAVSRQELSEQVWPNQLISETTVENTVKVVRRAIGDSGRAQQLIQTMYGYGYGFVAPVTAASEGRESDEVHAGSVSPGPVPRPPRGPGEAAPTQVRLEPHLTSGPPPLDHSPAPRPPAIAPRDCPSGASETPVAERRQLTVMFCDLVDSTALASQLDPEDFYEVIRAYQDTCAGIIRDFDGHIARYLGDGLLVYFGYPLAHEDDARRAVRAALSMLETVDQLNARFARHRGIQLALRLGIHTGLVVVGAIGRGSQPEQLALGETPNLAARLQRIADPNTVVISAATQRLIEGFFTLQPLGPQSLKGLAQPVEVSRVLYESAARSRLEAAVRTSLTPLVGREQEIGLLLERWEQVKEGLGQVILLSGEAGIGKSRLVQVFKEHVANDPQAWLIPCQCSAYYQNSFLYPVIDLLQRVVLQFFRDELPHQRLGKLEGFLTQHGLSLPDTVPLFAALLSIPAEGYVPLNLSPEQQRQKTLQALLRLLLVRAARQPVVFVMEDMHWVDPSTLEWLGLLVDQGPTARILTLLTFRPEFSPPWTRRSHLTQITLNRLTRRQVAEMVARVALGKTLPAEVLREVVTKTDGVPLFVEELTKMVLESEWFQQWERLGVGATGRSPLPGSLTPLAIPSTLHDSLMARLDRLGSAKEVAQLAATLGREFMYEVLQAVSLVDDAALQQALAQLVEAELLYQRGFPPQVMYLFKHGLIQETDYQSLLRSRRQRFHQQIAQVLERRFPEIAETQPELLAHHCTGAGLNEQAIPYWLRAAMSLGRLWRRQGEAAKARELLGGIYAWFTEGFDTADLQEAKAFLNQST